MNSDCAESDCESLVLAFNFQLTTRIYVYETLCPKKSGKGGQGGCEPRIEIIVKMKKVRMGRGGCEPRIEVIVKMKKTHYFTARSNFVIWAFP